MEQENQDLLFNPENYRDTVVDIVNQESLIRVISGKKASDPATINEAKIIKQRIEQLVNSGIPVRFIDDRLTFIKPSDEKQIVVGGAFDGTGQCIEEYLKDAERQGIILKPDPLLTLKLD